MNHQRLLTRVHTDNTVFVSTLHGVRPRNFRARGGREQRNRPQKRIFREKLPLDTLRGHKQHQPRLHGLDIGACKFRTKDGHFVKNQGLKLRS